MTVELSGVLVSESGPTSNVGGRGARYDGEPGRRTFLKGLGTLGAALSGGAIMTTAAAADDDRTISKGDAALLRFAAAAEIIESDLWLQYAELGGVQDDEVSLLASQLIPGYPAKATGGNPTYIKGLQFLDGDMPQYIHDNTEDELTHEHFINAYLESKGAEPVNLDKFRILHGSQATGANKSFPRLTNLTQLTVDTTWWTRYRSRTKNPDPPFNDTFPPAIPTLATGRHTAIPRTDSDTTNGNFIQAVANTAGFHFAFIEQGGTSLYPGLAQRANSVEVLRILLSIGGTEICHFQTWHDKAGNAKVLANVIDPVTHVSVTFPDLNTPPSEDLQTNLIMPEPTVFLSRQFPPCSIIRPTETKGAAMAAVKSLTDDGLFIGQLSEFGELLEHLAAEADAARRDGGD
ncbi:MAG TPA: ferritin-like domain-containing protein [Isosphaeraceae bacterium]|nr:ferritin-like domain-containing protein [Isosphaeraceae bacterium]